MRRLLCSLGKEEERRVFVQLYKQTINMRKIMWKKIFNTNDKKEDDFKDFDFGNEVTDNDEPPIAMEAETNDFDFSFDDEPATPVGENVIKRQNTINEKEAEKRAIAQREAVVSNAYDHIIGSFKVAPRNDQSFYEAFKAERLERFKQLSIVVADICDRHLGDRSYYQYHFNCHIFDEEVNGKMIDTLCDIIQCLVRNDGEYYDSHKSMFPDDIKFAIKTLTVAIVDLSEGNI